LKKDHLEVSANNAFNPSRNLVPECSPVAGTDLQELTCSCLMPDERREFHKIRPTSHTLLSVNCLYQMNMEKRKGMFTNWVQASVNLLSSSDPYAEDLTLLLKAISFVIMLSPYGVKHQ
jgi:hypothetical protein